VNNDLIKLGSLSVMEMVRLKVKGLGPVKAITIAAALELGIRRVTTEQRKETIASSSDAAYYLKAKLQHKSNEVFVVIFLNNANKVLHHETVSEGGISATVADARVILRKAIEHNATGIILSHNHPSGKLKPSKQDEVITYNIKEAASYFDIKVLDHIIVSSEGFYSFADNGLI
jgi:DNA repair protein RadC